MSDITAAASTPSIDRRAPPPPQITNTLAYGMSAGFALGLIHWIMKCYETGHFVFTKPDDALIEMAVGFSLPTIHLISRIINNHLKKLAGENE